MSLDHNVSCAHTLLAATLTTNMFCNSLQICHGKVQNFLVLLAVLLWFCSCLFAVLLMSGFFAFHLMQIGAVVKGFMGCHYTYCVKLAGLSSNTTLCKVA